jgi:hypothetical protein
VIDEAPRLSAPVRRRLNLVFAPAERQAAAALLAARCGENLGVPCGSPAERIQCAALRASGGTLEGLERAVRLGEIDWRDLLVEADFANDIHAHDRWLAEGSAAAQHAAARWRR